MHTNALGLFELRVYCLLRSVFVICLSDGSCRYEEALQDEELNSLHEELASVKRRIAEATTARL
jgi:hypothetical protein